MKKPSKTSESTGSFKIPTNLGALLKQLKEYGIYGAIIGSFFLFQWLMQPQITENKNDIKILNEKVVDLSAEIKVLKSTIRDIKRERRGD